MTKFERRGLILYTRAECHLCEVAKAEIRKKIGEIPIEEIDVDSDPALAARFGEEVPVGFVGGEKAFKYHVDIRRLRRLLRNAGEN
ncbi:MAG: glutaredoxin family protein [bacterium]